MGNQCPSAGPKTLLHLVRCISIAIHPDELIVRNRSLLPRMSVIAPERGVDWTDRELEVLPTRPQDRFSIRPGQIRELREEVFPCRPGKTLEDIIAVHIPEDVNEAIQGKAFSLNQTDHAQGHILPDARGWLGLRDTIEAARVAPIQRDSLAAVR